MREAFHLEERDPMSISLSAPAADSIERLEIVNPASEAILAELTSADRNDLDRMVAAATEAFPAWRDTPLAQRKTAIQGIGKLITENADELAALLTAEQGKPLAQARSELSGAAAWCTGIADQAIEDEMLQETAERIVVKRHVPLGVVGAIVPWNYPVALAIWKIAPAIVTGNCIIVKPSPFTPLTTMRVIELAQALLPTGVLQVIVGGDALGPWMTEHPGITKISFTGSTATGRRVMASCSASLKRVTLELGGNDAAIVFPDVDVDAVVPQIFWTAFVNSGQLCVATKRVYIHEDIYDEFRDALIAFSRTVMMGDGAAEGVALGPVQNRQQYERLQSLLAETAGGAANQITPQPVSNSSGYFVPVTFIDNPPEDSSIVQEEQFGPILPLLKFSDTDDVIRRVNASEFGLGGSVWTTDPDLAIEVAQKIDSGSVWINQPQYLSPFVPFSGHKQSGLGVENGRDGILEYTNVQTITRGPIG
jgi:aldehyde dehydrogenase (NAD+)